MASSPFLARNRVMRGMAEQIWRFAATDSNVLVAGETGTGKNAIAPTLEVVEQRCIAATPERVRGNQTEAARLPGIIRKAPWEKRKRYGLH